jgi:hypothetical protein
LQSVRLLDEALELDAPGRLRWLLALPAENSRSRQCCARVLIRNPNQPANLLVWLN